MLDFNKQFFVKYQKQLLWIANHWFSRWLLGLNRLPEQIKKDVGGNKYCKIDVASVYWQTGKIIWKGKKKSRPEYEYKGYFFARPRFAEALAYNLSPFAYLMNMEQSKFQWRFSPVGALGIFLLAFFGHGFAFAGTTTSYYSGNGDGQAQRLTTTPYENFATIRAGDGNGNNNDNDYHALGRIAASSSADTWEILVRGIIQIDTSGLTSGASITGASLFNYIIGYRDNLSAQSLSITSVTTSSNTSLTNSDFDLANHGSTKLASDKALSTLSTSAYLQTDLNASGLSNISKTGYSKFSYRLSCDVDNSAPTWSSGQDAVIDASNSRTTGTSQDPYISVTYTISSSSSSSSSSSNSFSSSSSSSSFSSSSSSFSSSSSSSSSGFSSSSSSSSFSSSSFSSSSSSLSFSSSSSSSSFSSSSSSSSFSSCSSSSSFSSSSSSSSFSSSSSSSSSFSSSCSSSSSFSSSSSSFSSSSSSRSSNSNGIWVNTAKSSSPTWVNTDKPV